jgi:hypothetical protein
VLETLTIIVQKEKNKDQLEAKRDQFLQIINSEDLDSLYDHLRQRLVSREELFTKDLDLMKILFLSLKGIFSILERKQEYAFYLSKYVKLLRQNEKDSNFLEVLEGLQECSKYNDIIPDFHLEFAKYIPNSLEVINKYFF